MHKFREVIYFIIYLANLVVYGGIFKSLKCKRVSTEFIKSLENFPKLSREAEAIFLKHEIIE